MSDPPRDPRRRRRRWLARHGVPRARIVEDPEGVTTHATARDTARILKARG